jgi:hypothetical protein
MEPSRRAALQMMVAVPEQDTILSFHTGVCMHPARRMPLFDVIVAQTRVPQETMP